MLPEFQGYHHPLLDQRDLVAAGDATDFVLFGPVDTGHIWMVTVATFLNDTRAAGVPILTLIRGGREFQLDSGVALTQSLPVNIDGMLFIPEGCQLKMRLMTLTAGDVVHFTIGGLDLVRFDPGPKASGA